MDLLSQLASHGKDIQLFDDGECALRPAYLKLTGEISDLRKRLLQCCGPEIEEMLDEYTELVESKEDFIAEHYFEQGVLAGRR